MMNDANKGKSFKENHRRLVQFIKSNKPSISSLGPDGKFAVATTLCDSLLEQAKHAREFCQESQVFRMVSENGAAQFKNGITREEFVANIRRLLNSHGNEFQGWRHIQSHFPGIKECPATVGVECLLGTLGAPSRHRIRATQQCDGTTHQLSRPIQGSQMCQKQDPSNARTTALYKLLKAHGSTPFPETVLDKESFWETVLNIFSLQHLVKDGIADISGSSPEKGLLVEALGVEGRGQRSRRSRSQIILPVNASLWKCMKEVVKDQHCLMDGWRKCQSSSPSSTLGKRSQHPASIEEDTPSQKRSAVTNSEPEDQCQHTGRESRGAKVIDTVSWLQSGNPGPATSSDLGHTKKLPQFSSHSRGDIVEEKLEEAAQAGPSMLREETQPEPPLRTPDRMTGSTHHTLELSGCRLRVRRVQSPNNAQGPSPQGSGLSRFLREDNQYQETGGIASGHVCTPKRMKVKTRAELVQAGLLRSGSSDFGQVQHPKDYSPNIRTPQKQLSITSFLTRVSPETGGRRVAIKTEDGQDTKHLSVSFGTLDPADAHSDEEVIDLTI